MAGISAHNLPQHTSLDELVEFFDDHDMGDYLEGMAEVEFAVDIKSRKHLVAIEQEIASKLTEIARTEQVTAEALINSWLKERISNYSEEHKGSAYVALRCVTVHDRMRLRTVRDRMTRFFSRRFDKNFHTF